MHVIQREQKTAIVSPISTKIDIEFILYPQLANQNQSCKINFILKYSLTWNAESWKATGQFQLEKSKELYLICTTRLRSDNYYLIPFQLKDTCQFVHAIDNNCMEQKGNLYCTFHFVHYCVNLKSTRKMFACTGNSILMWLIRNFLARVCSIRNQSFKHTNWRNIQVLKEKLLGQLRSCYTKPADNPN